MTKSTNISFSSNGSTRYVAMLGFAHVLRPDNTLLACQLGRHLAQLGVGIAVGNTHGAYRYALLSAMLYKGKSLAILEAQHRFFLTPKIDDISFAKSSKTKHGMIADRAIGAIAIGGGPGTLKLIHEFSTRQKPVVAITNSGGFTQTHSPPGVSFCRGISTAVEQLIGQLN